MTTAVAAQPELLGRATRALLDDPSIDGVSISIPFGGVAAGYTKGLEDHVGKNHPLVTLSIMNDTTPIDPDLAQRFQEINIPISYSPERTLRAVATVRSYGQRLAADWTKIDHAPFDDLPTLRPGLNPEWQGKALLSAIGIVVPSGGLATSIEEAVETAGDIGYPMVMKAQGADLAHKTEAGAVLLGIDNEAALLDGWQTLHTNVESAAPGVQLDGILVETMVTGGVELAIGGRRDPEWGPVIMVGLGGIWIEVIGDVRILTADASALQIRDELLRLKSAKLLEEFRGRPAVDIDAVAEAASLIGRLMLCHPGIQEVDVNPILAHAAGEGATALDALIVNAE